MDLFIWLVLSVGLWLSGYQFGINRVRRQVLDVLKKDSDRRITLLETITDVEQAMEAVFTERNRLWDEVSEVI